MNSNGKDVDGYGYLFNFVMDIAIVVTIGVLVYRVMAALGFAQMVIFGAVGLLALYTGIKPKLLRDNFSFFYIKNSKKNRGEDDDEIF